MKRLLATIGCVGMIGGASLFAAPVAQAGVGNCTAAYLRSLPGDPAHHARYPACIFGDVATCLSWGGPPAQLAACLAD